jgi:glycolate oxidase FAD binding subunit
MKGKEIPHSRTKMMVQDDKSVWIVGELTKNGVSLIAVIEKELAEIIPAEQIVPWTAWDAKLYGVFATTPESLWVVYPKTAAELADVMTLAHQKGWTVLVAGQGSKLSWGGLAKNTHLVVNTARLNGLIDHAVGDMTVTVEAGMYFAQLQKLLAPSNQWLPLDPAYPDQATIGGILATRDGGSLRHRYGSLRDLCLGLTFVRADGQIAKAGGRVVKNVAGYDLMKLFTGSFGTLGILTEVTLRLYPKPEFSKTIRVWGKALDLDAFLRSLLKTTLTPTAVDVIVFNQMSIAVRFQSLPESVMVQVQRCCDLADKNHLAMEVCLEEDEVQCWLHLREDKRPEQVFCKIGVLPTEAIATLDTIKTLCDQKDSTLSVRFHAASGVGMLSLSADTTTLAELISMVRSRCESAGGYLTVLEAPVAVKQQVDVWGMPESNTLAAMRQLKKHFDPQHLLNPGRFVGGI